VKTLGTPNIDLTKFFDAAPTHEINGKSVDAKTLINSVSMISMKLDSGNVEHVKYLTTEGLTKKQRLKFLNDAKQELNADLFELSTCNRVLYVGFDVTSTELESSVLRTASLESAPFEHFSGIDVWRHLVKVCSGLDSFILGELQVMSQFRGSVAWHRKHGLLSDINGSFFEHVVSANRMIRREFGFNQTTESMLNLATSALEEIVPSNETTSSLVLGFGEMGSKAVEVLLSLGQTDISVISRSPEQAALRNPDIAAQVNIITFEDWKSKRLSPNLIISTIRNNTATYNETNPIPSTSKAVIMDFSWPPSIDVSGISENHELFGTEYWIRASHRLGIEWDYSSTIEKSEAMISQIQQRFMDALTDKTRAKFRAFMYQTLEALSQQWEQSEYAGDSSTQLGAFSREIATWICNQDGPFTTVELDNMVLSTNRQINPTLLKRVASDVNETIIRINEKSTLPEALL
jgi:glutamyl-tRNA reductase